MTTTSSPSPRASRSAGPGTCAVSPPRTSMSNLPLTESFKLQPNLEPAAISFKVDASECDHDGYLDAGERGVVKVTVVNAGSPKPSTVRRRRDGERTHQAAPLPERRVGARGQPRAVRERRDLGAGRGRSQGDRARLHRHPRDAALTGVVRRRSDDLDRGGAQRRRAPRRARRPEQRRGARHRDVEALGGRSAACRCGSAEEAGHGNHMWHGVDEGFPQRHVARVADARRGSRDRSRSRCTSRTGTLPFEVQPDDELGRRRHRDHDRRRRMSSERRASMYWTVLLRAA